MSDIILHKDLRGADLHPPGVHTHVEADIINLDKYTRSQTDNLLTQKVSISNNLSDLQSPLSARSNLGLGSLATQNGNYSTDLSAKLDKTGGSLSGALSMGAHAINNLQDPVNAQDAATKAYADAIASGLSIKNSVIAATTAALAAYTFTGNVLTANANGAFPAIDGVTLSLNDRILVKDESGGNAQYNGIYTLTQVGDGSHPWKLTRSTDTDTSPEMTSGVYCLVTQGTLNESTGWVLITPNPIVLNTTTLDFTQFSAVSSVSAGTGITVSGSLVSLDTTYSDGRYLKKAGDTMSGSLAFSGTTNPGITLNALTTTQRNALTPSNGTMLYNSTLKQVQKYENSQWVDTGKSPATVVVAPAGSGFAADFYTTGTGDDTVLQAAFDAANAAGGGLVLCKYNFNNYNLNNPVNFYSNVWLDAEGSTFFEPNGANINNMFALTGVSNVVIKNLTIDGNKANQTAQSYGIIINGNSSKVKLDTVYIKNTSYDGFKVFQASDFKFLNCNAYQCGKTGLVGQGNGGFNITSASDFILDNCKADGCNFEALNVFSCNDFQIKNCKGINSVTEHGIHPNLCYNFSIIGGEYTGNGTDGLKIIDCHDYEVIGVDGNNNTNIGINSSGNISTSYNQKILGCNANGNTRGIYCSNGGGSNTLYNVEVVGNNAAGNSSWGIAISVGSNCTISGNVSYNNQYGIVCSGTCLNNVITGNRCYGNQYGYVDNDYSTVTGNDFTGNSSGAVLTPGAHSVFAANKGYHQWVDGRNTTNNTAGGNMTVAAEGATIGSTDKLGGDYNIQAGIPTGTAVSSIRFWTYKPASATSTTDGTLNNSLVINQTSSGSILISPANGASGAVGNFTSYGARGAGSGANLNGGDVSVQAGRSTGSGFAGIDFRTASPSSASALTALSSIAINARGSAYVANDVLTISGGSGSGGTITVNTVAGIGVIATTQVNTGGTGYAIGNVLTVTGGNGDATLTVSTLDVNGGIQTYVLSGGTGYSTATGVSVTGGAGSGAKIDILTVFATGAILTFTLTTAGTGYVSTTGAATTGGAGDGLATFNLTPFSNAINSPTTKMYLTGAGNLGVGTITPTAAIHVKAGTSTNPPFKLTTGTLVSVITGNVNDGALEYSASHLYFTIGSTRYQIDQQPETVTSVNGQTGAVVLTTTNIAEGTNLYYTDARVRLNRLDQMAAPTASVSMGSQKIANLLDPTAAQDAATKNYVDTVAQGLSAKPSAVVATTAGLPSYTYSNGISGVGATITAAATGFLTIDGYTVAVNDYVLIKNETSTNAPYNGLYKCTVAGAVGVAFVLTRAVEMDTSTEFVGAFIFVESGTANGSSGWVCLDTGAFSTGTTNVTFTQFSGAGEITAGTGLTKSGNTLSIDTAYLGQASITTLGTITTGTWNGSVISEVYGGTNQSSYTLGDTLYASAVNTLSKLAGNTTATKKFLRQTGTGSVSAVPAWDTVTSTDVGLGNVENTAISTWEGSANITTLGTISTGTWAGSAIDHTHLTGIVQSDVGGLTTASSPTFAGLSLGTGSLNTVGNIEIDGTAARDITVGRATSGAGANQTVQAGGGQSGATNANGGDLLFKSGIPTGNGSSNIRWFVPTTAGSGTGDTTPSEQLNLSSNGRLSLGNGSTLGVNRGFTFGGQNAQVVQMVRTTTASTTGFSLTVQSGGAKSGGTNLTSGALLLQTGLSTGNAVPGLIQLQSNAIAAASGTGDNALIDRVIASAAKVLTNNSAINLVNCTLISNTIIGGIIRYAVEVFDGTNLQMEVGEILYECANKGGVFSGNTITQLANNGTTIATPKQFLGSGSLTCTWAITNANPAVISLNVNSLLTPSTGYPRITYTVENFTQQALAIQ